MDNYMGIIMIAAACIFVLLIGAFRNKKEWIINFIFRSVIGTVAIFSVTGFSFRKGCPLQLESTRLLF